MYLKPTFIAILLPNLLSQAVESINLSQYFREKVEEEKFKDFYIGLHGKYWVKSLDFFEKIAESLMTLSPHKRPN
ncbi:MAG: hypothetical protein F6K41_09250 [Symploca sp. SIO3E6]|nr:hypothetical protein [Caldora sp. SIO3E6]